MGKGLGRGKYTGMCGECLAFRGAHVHEFGECLSIQPVDHNGRCALYDIELVTDL